MPLQWGEAERAVDFFDVKGDLEALFGRVRPSFVPAAHPALHPGRSAAIEVDGCRVGFVGELHPRRRQAYELAGIASVCSAHPLVIEAALRHGKARGADVLIEATCNQVNQDGGYTGMTPAEFRGFVEGVAARVGFPLDRLVLGGDHLGPNPWKQLPPEAAMAKACVMVAAYAKAGFAKIDLDASMGCAGEPAAPPDQTIAARAAALAAVAEAGAGGVPPVYVIGTEVPVPGGALEALDHLQVTRPEDVARTVEIHRAAFAALGLGSAFERAMGIVVQPGVEFGNAECGRL